LKTLPYNGYDLHLQQEPLAKQSYHPLKSQENLWLILYYLHSLNHIPAASLTATIFWKSFAKRNTVSAAYYLVLPEHYKYNRNWRSLRNRFKMLVYSFLSRFVVKWRNGEYCNKRRKSLVCNSSTIFLVSFPPTPKLMVIVRHYSRPLF
jgi:hypothetical protein